MSCDNCVCVMKCAQLLLYMGSLTVAVDCVKKAASRKDDRNTRPSKMEEGTGGLP